MFTTVLVAAFVFSLGQPQSFAVIDWCVPAMEVFFKVCLSSGSGRGMELQKIAIVHKVMMVGDSLRWS